MDPLVAAAALAGAKVAADTAKAVVIDPARDVVAATMKEFYEQKLLPRFRRILSLDEAAQLAGVDVQARLADVPAELLVTPSSTIAAGVVEALQTRADEPALRGMFADLLANACRADRAGAVHLAHVEVLRQLEPADAALFAHVCGRVRQRGIDAEMYPDAPHWRTRPRLIVMDAVDLAREAGLPHPSRGPLALDNLKRVGLLGDLVTDATGARILAGPTAGVVLTPFGEAFARACIPSAARALDGA